MTGKRNMRIFGATGCAFVALAIGAFAITHAHRGGSCYGGDPGVPSAVADPALFGATREVTGSREVVVEAVQGRSLGERKAIAVDGGSLLGISGWAIDPLAKRAATVVLARVDDQPLLRADSCGDRSDVARALGSPAYARSGFGLRLKAAPGVHRLAFFVLSPDGRTLYHDPSGLEIDVIRPGGDRGVPAVQGGLTELDDAQIPAPVSAGARYSHPIGTDFRIQGWMIDRTSGDPAPLRSLDVVLDGRLVDRAAYGSWRPDVADFVHAPALTNSGFSARFLTDGLRPGRHVITLRATVADGRRAVFDPRLVVELTPRRAAARHRRADTCLLSARRPCIARAARALAL